MKEWIRNNTLAITFVLIMFIVLSPILYLTYSSSRRFTDAEMKCAGKGGVMIPAMKGGIGACIKGEYISL